MTARRQTRGRPLIALFMVLSLWTAGRAALWEAVAFTPYRLPAIVAASAPPARLVADSTAGVGKQRSPIGNENTATRPLSTQIDQNLRVPSEPFIPAPRMETSAEWPIPEPLEPTSRSTSVTVGAAAGHQSLMMAALAHLPLPAGLLSNRRAVPASPSGARHELSHAAAPRWSADGWLYLRQGGSASLAASTSPATYGASQAGSVVRYTLAPASNRRPTAYLRATAALGRSGEKEAALGLSVRPIATLPVIAAIEARAAQLGGSTKARPAAMLVTQAPPFALPLGVSGEVYGQAGYVGGGNATTFADGQLRADREALRVGSTAVRIGAGVWAGAQKGATRLDLGPGATVRVGLGNAASARIALDWRFRVGGNAAPRSGPALTIGAGF